jgi:hypothetical protein
MGPGELGERGGFTREGSSDTLGATRDARRTTIMRRIGTCSLLLLGLCGVAALGAPTITVDTPVYTASVQSGSIVRHTFTLANTGDETLSITTVQTSCGCTTTALSKSSLAPGESIGLDATVNTAGFVGTVERTLTIQSNDPVNPNLVLRLALTMVDEAPAQTNPSAPVSAQTPASTQTSAPNSVALVSTSPATAPAAFWALVLVGILAVGLVFLLVAALGV